jgi:hypothetical protein
VAQSLHYGITVHPGKAFAMLLYLEALFQSPLIASLLPGFSFIHTTPPFTGWPIITWGTK